MVMKCIIYTNGARRGEVDRVSDEEAASLYMNKEAEYINKELYKTLTSEKPKLRAWLNKFLIFFTFSFLFGKQKI
jgi:hypothetical protein